MQKTKITFYSALLLVMFFAACRMGKDYQRPDVALPKQFGKTAPSDSSVADMEWKKFFSDATLQSLIASALKNNYDMQLAMKRVEEAHAYAKQAKVNWVPAIQAQAAASTSFPSKNSLNGLSLKN